MSFARRPLTFGLLVLCFSSHTAIAQEAASPVNPAIKERDQTWNQAIRVANEGKLDEATMLLEQVYKLEESISGPAHPTLLEILGVLAQVADIKQDDKSVIDVRKRQHRVTEQLYGKTDYRTQDAKRQITDAVQRAKLTPEQRSRLSNAVEMSGLVAKMFGEKRFAEAIPIAERSVAVHREILGEQHQDHAMALNWLSQLHQSNGDSANAVLPLIEVLNIQKQNLGELHPEHITTLNRLASLYHSSGDALRAKPLLQQAKSLMEQQRGVQHPEHAAILHNLAEIYRLESDFGRAEPMLKQSIKIFSERYGENTDEHANNLNSLGLLYEASGNYSDAEDVFEQAKKIVQSLYGKNHPVYAISLNNLASLEVSLGNYSHAEQLYTQALEINKQVFGVQHPSYALSLNNLAMLYTSAGDFAHAKTLYTRAIEIDKRVLGEQHPSYAAKLNNLAGLYVKMADYTRAEPLFTQALKIHQRVFGEQHTTYAASLNNLAALYKLVGDYASAEPLHKRALEIHKRVLGEQHVDYATSLNNLAALYDDMGDYARAAPLYTRAMEIRKQVLGDRHKDYATSLNNLAGLYAKMDEYVLAEHMYIQASEIDSQAFGEQHPSCALGQHNLAMLYELMGDYDRAQPLYVQSIVKSRQHLNETAGVLTEQQQIAMNRSLRFQLDNSVTCSLAMKALPKAITEQVIAWKGAVLVRLRALRLAADDPAIAGTFKQLQSKTQQLSALTNAVPGPEKLDAWKAQLADLTEQREKLDQELMRGSAAFRSVQKNVSLDDVRQSIPTNGVIVDYFEYGGKQGRSLVATVIRRDADPMMMDLGSAVDAGNTISRWRASLGADDEAKQAGEQLRQQLWEPLLPLIGDAKMVFVSPDGVLGQLPFAALPGKAKGSYLIEDHAIVMLPVPILLPKLMEREVGESKLLAGASSAAGTVTGLLMGDVDYDFASKTAPTTPTAEPNSSAPLLLANNTISRTRGDTTYPPLAGTGPEIGAIAKLFRSHRDFADQNLIELRQRDATESAFRAAASSAQWLHLATHGFFAPEDKKNALSAAEIAKSKSTLQMFGFGDNKHQPFVGFSPGQLSGLVFAGVNQPPQPIDPLAPIEPIDDGIMTADEIAYMQLENVELAVLSACETGLGETAGGEGILGLQRAFQVAGARTTVTSLWQVDDAATQALMVEFYRNLFEKKLSKLESLRQAQLWLLNNPEAIEGRNLTARGQVRETKVTPETRVDQDKTTRSLPVYWAAFQLSGDPR